MPEDREAHQQKPRRKVREPEQFSFEAKDWPGWKRQWELYYDLEEMENDPEKIRVSTFLYLMGPQASEILSTFDLTAADRRKYENVFHCFDQLFSAKVNVVFERARFNRRVQREREPVELFVMDLKQLASTCKYGTLKDELIRDRIIVSIGDEALSLALAQEDERVLTLEKCVARVTTAENVLTNATTIRESSGPAVQVHVVKNNYQNSRKNQRHQTQTSESKSSYSKSKQPDRQCGYCRGKWHKDKLKCPARGQTCHSCGKLDHFGPMCRSKRKIQELEEADGETEDEENQVEEVQGPQRYSFLEVVNQPKPKVSPMIEVEEMNVPPLMLDILVGGRVMLRHKADLGADVNVIGQDYLSKFPGVKLEPIGNLTGAGKHVLQVGKFQTTMEWEGRKETT
ncbi:Gag-Pol polyprotein [Frankliniella fusca]|uniref:Gag-Pol polyprotein n=1 Tax=Frankliniella fusca TaxID=407009 RepID=A0AAE1LG24_9NEOP|nr:Gag-Pol polyprotein [Frankliniella fusca]